ncbi:serpin family protein [Oscillatoria acuminata]|uniref:Serine protease inhibitor n=1 Tax=Oscillatoria acuminata PCC 6304 TaxID=56110 RepID=K9TKP6_9CYAN|nr:serpin family protein [Oscillatoria acuminata]AFY83115.1 serine protease inhibitor [Oscillatoria acuminata PCC 6304]
MKKDCMDAVRPIALLGAVAIATLGWMARLEGSEPLSAQIPAINMSGHRAFGPGWITLNGTLENTVETKPIIAANTRFGIKLFSHIYQQEKAKNIFISPLSLTLALQMLNGGATGETHEAIASVLETPGMEQQQIDLTLSALHTHLHEMDSEVELTIANSFWMKEGGSFNPNFIQRTETSYQALTREIDFSSPATAAPVINGWIAEETHQRIDHILEPNDFDSGTIAMLINAIYFKSAWLSPFSESDTREHPFALADGQMKAHPLMFQTQEFAYYENALFQAISLPYGNTAEVNLYIFLPNPEVGLDLFLEHLNAENWNLWLKEYWENKPIRLGLPRFKIEYDIELKDILTAMNMGIAFSSEADFSSITSEPFWISKIKHKTFLEVNEEGTEASAVTGILGTRSGPVDMIIDRPFFFAIRDDNTGTLLFMGTLVNPLE